MSDYKNGYRSEVPRYELIPLERKKYEEYIETRDLVELKGVNHMKLILIMVDKDIHIFIPEQKIWED